MQQPPGANRCLRRRTSAPASRRLSAPSAVKFHSTPSMSSIDTNVGSPPIVKRTSQAARSSSTRRGRAQSICRHCVVGVRLGDARRLVDAPHAHLVAEDHLALVDCAADGRGALRIRRGGQRNVSFAREQPGRRIESDPAGAGEIHLGPRMQVGEIGCRTDRPVERLDVGRQLDQVTGDESRRQPEMAKRLAPAARRCRGTSRSRATASLPASARPARA